MNPKVKPPIFIVGCPRSGTTLLQSLLSAHPDIHSFPESKFFQYLTPSQYEPKRYAFGLISRQLPKQLTRFFQHELHRPDLLQHWSPIPLQSLYSKKFLKTLNQLTQEKGKRIWVEKTPQHIYYLEDIERFVPQAKIIHSLRSGTDVVASLYEVTHQYPQGWGGHGWDIEQCIDWWVRATEISHRYLHQPNHRLVRYEHLVEAPQTVLHHLCQFIGVEFDPKMLQDYKFAAKQVSLEVEPWKALASQAIQNTNSRKFYQVFDEAQQNYIRKRLSGLDEFDDG